jgi:hypothetical protein
MTHYWADKRRAQTEHIIPLTGNKSHKTVSPSLYVYTEHTQNNGADLIVNTIKTAPFFYVCPVHTHETLNSVPMYQGTLTVTDRHARWQRLL